MAKEKKLVEDITSMSEDFAQWYTDVVKQAELMRYSSVKGCMMILPNGYAIWENIQKNLDAIVPVLKAAGCEINDLNAVVRADKGRFIIPEDGCHLTEEGAQACAEAVVKAVLPYLV